MTFPTAGVEGEDLRQKGSEDRTQRGNFKVLHTANSSLIKVLPTASVWLALSRAAVEQP